MAKLYAELTSDKGGRVASKAGNSRIEVILKVGNIRTAVIILTPTELILLDKNGSHELTKHL